MVDKIKYSPTLKISNLEILPKGVGSKVKYLEVLRGENDILVAVCWRTKAPKTLPKFRALVCF